MGIELDEVTHYQAVPNVFPGAAVEEQPYFSRSQVIARYRLDNPQAVKVKAYSLLERVIVDIMIMVRPGG